MKQVKILWLMAFFFIATSISWADNPALGELKPGVYPLLPVSNHTPGSFRNTKDYWSSFQKVELETGKQEQFKDLPKLGMKNPYTGVISLGDQPQKFGVIVDINGEEKRLYIDTNGDGSFTKEPWTLLLNEWYGLQIYLIIGPEPITLFVNYKLKKDQSFPLQISVQGLLNKPGNFLKEKPYLLVAVRTWFLAKIFEDGSEKLVAIVDKNNNGSFNDPEDQIYIDYNDDGYFSPNEMISRKKQVSLKSGKQKLAVDWAAYPDQLVIGGKASD